MIKPKSELGIIHFCDKSKTQHSIARMAARYPITQWRIAYQTEDRYGQVYIELILDTRTIEIPIGRFFLPDNTHSELFESRSIQICEFLDFLDPKLLKIQIKK